MREGSSITMPESQSSSSFFKPAFRFQNLVPDLLFLTGGMTADATTSLLVDGHGAMTDQAALERQFYVLRCGWGRALD